MTTPGRRARRSSRLRLRGLLVVLIVAAGAYAYRGFHKSAHKVSYPPNAFHEVKRADMLISIVEDGALRALNETVIRSGLEGLNRIIHLVPEGTHVKKGELLVELDSSGLKDRLTEQELAYQERLFQLLQATENLKIQKSLAESQIKDGELRVENAQADLERYRDGEAPLLIKTIEGRIGVISNQVRIANERYARTEELFKGGNATRSEVEADSLSVKREQLALGQYQEDLRLVKKFDQPNQVLLLQSKVEQARADLERLKQRTSNEITQAEGDLKTSQRSVELLDESLKTQKRRLENAKIFAPQDGLVVYAAVSPFSFMGGNEGRRDEGRFRAGRNGSGQGGGGNGEFRGGGRRGGRSSLETSSSGSPSSSSSTQTVARIASASGGAASGSATGDAGNSGSAAASGSRGGGGSSSGGDIQSASRSFVSYPSLRPSSTLGSSKTTSDTFGSGSSSLNSSASSSGNGQNSSTIAPQFGFRPNSQSFQGPDFYGTPGILEEGLMVRQRQELIRLPDVSKMIAEIKIHESRVQQVRAGMTAYVRVENIPDRHFKGTVRRVAPLPDSQASWMNPNLKVFPTDILVEEQLPELKPGVSARAEVIITNLTQVLSVPIHTVARLKGEHVCFVKRGSGVTPVPVTTGWFNDRLVEVTSGLKEGDFVLLAPVGDEAIEDASSASTNEVDSATEQPSRPAQATEESPAAEPRIQRRNSDSNDGEAQPERRRNRQGRRSQQNSQEAPE